MGVRVKPSSVPGAGRGLWSAWSNGLPAQHDIPYTGNDIELDDEAAGGPYVLQTKRGSGFCTVTYHCELAPL